MSSPRKKVSQPGKSLSFVGRFCRKGNKIKHFPQPAPHPQSVLLFNFTAVQIGGEVGLHAKRVVIIIAAENNFCHHLASVAIMLCFIFEAQVVKAIDDRLKFFDREGPFGVAVKTCNLKMNRVIYIKNYFD